MAPAKVRSSAVSIYWSGPPRAAFCVNGQDITQLNKAALRDYRLRTGMIFQHFNLLHARTVADNVAVPLEIAGVPRAAREARVRELLALGGSQRKGRRFPVTAFRRAKAARRHRPGAGRPAGSAAVR